jgi:cell wall-associated NlpC family hydrolase
VLVTLRRRRAQTLTLLVLCLAVIAGLLSAPAISARAADPPPNPTDGQISAAAKEKANLADEVGRLSAKVVQQQAQLNQLKAALEMAEQKVANALDKLQQAKDASAQAAQAVTAANVRVDSAQKQYQSFVAATYMSGDIGGTTGSLLTADDPNIVLEHSALEEYETDHQLDAIGNLKTATVAKSNADAAARKAVKNQKAATKAAEVAQQNANAALISAQAEEKALETSLAANQTALNAAQEHLATLNHQRAAYIAYQQEQARIRAAALRAKRIAEAKARAAAARERAREAQAAAAAAAAERRREQQGDGSSSGSSGGSSGGGGGGGGGGSSAPTPSGGQWSQAKANVAVSRAMKYLGWMYAWAGGNSSGPTYGVCAGDGAFNDCHVLGFDCSGLVLYGWAPSIHLDHYAATQYWQAGSQHPSISNLLPGDLVFWSSNGSASGIHHVAMYIGNGNVIQAPESGEVIQITPVGSVSWGLYGATRPLT